MKVLVTGGAGFLGLHVEKKCVSMGCEVTLLDIAEFHPEDYDKSTKMVNGDVRDTAKMDALIAETDCVVHAAAALPLATREEIFSTNVDGTKNVLELCYKYKKRIVVISSTAVYGVPDHHPLFENDELIGVGNYGESKIALEKHCNEYREKGLYVTTIRPKTFIGTYRLGVFQILYNWIEEGHKIPLIGNGKNRYQLLEVDDLCDAIYLAMTHEGQDGNDIFNVGAISNLTENDYVGALCEYAKSGSRVMHTPVWLVIPTLVVLEKLHLSPLYKWVYGTAHKDSFVSVEKAQKVFGWQPKYDETQALIKSYQWYIDNKGSIAKGTGTTHRIAWAQGALAIIKKFL
ncbi:NAD(P)-dependent oxidoreductase [bacterium]|jgi:nucleoside-diphosphate-sugar epimerase|nr:NAD(P)-dependent oxidoreductase [bacterium]